jgi:hypothetical protein
MSHFEDKRCTAQAVFMMMLSFVIFLNCVIQGSGENVHRYFHFLAISTDIRLAKKGLNRLKQVPNPSLG